MTIDDIPQEESDLIRSIAAEGQREFRTRVLAELQRLEKAERSLIGGSDSLEGARRRRERADALKGAQSFIEKLAILQP